MVGSVTCDLCGLPLGKSPVAMGQGATIHWFCCKGCAQVYQLAERSGSLAVALAARPGGEASEPPAETAAGTEARSRRFSVAGMSCEGCAAAAQRVLKRQPGVLDAVVSLPSGQGSLTYDPARADPADVLLCLDKIGYHASLIEG